MGIIGFKDVWDSITKKQKEEAKKDKLIFGDNKDIILHIFSDHEKLENNVLMSYMENNPKKVDFVFRQFRLGGQIYYALVPSDDAIIDNIKINYLTYNINKKEIELKGQNEYNKEKLELEFFQKVANIKQKGIIEALKIKELLYNDIKYLTLVNRNVKDNYFSTVGIKPKDDEEELIKESLKDIKKNNEKDVKK